MTRWFLSVILPSLAGSNALVVTRCGPVVGGINVRDSELREQGKRSRRSAATPFLTAGRYVTGFNV
jgi:hypothetical protein